MFYTRTGVPVNCVRSFCADPLRLHRRARPRRAAAAARPRPPQPPATRSPSGAGPSILPAVEELGFEAHPTEPARKPPQRVPLQPLDPEREARDFRDGFVLRARERGPGIEALCRDWRPDVVVGEETHFGALLAAEQLGLPFASVRRARRGHARDPRADRRAARTSVRAEHGLPPDPDATMLSRQLVLAPLPPRYRDPRSRCLRRPLLLPPVRARRRERHDGTPIASTSPSARSSTSSRAISSPRVLTGVRELRSRSSRPSATEIDPAELGRAAGARPRRAVPAAGRGPTPLRASVVSHGGSGSVLGSLAHGLPQVLIPMGADQPLNADALRAARARARPRSGRRDPGGDRRRRLRRARGPLLPRRGAGAPGRVRRPAGAGSRGRADRAAARVSA